MDGAWLYGLYQAIASGLIVGLVVAVFKVRLDQSSKKIDEANDLKVTHLQEDLVKVWNEIVVVKGAVGKLDEKVGELTGSSRVMIAEQRNLSQRLTETNGNLRHMSDRIGVNFGKVVRKE